MKENLRREPAEMETYSKYIVDKRTAHIVRVCTKQFEQNVSYATNARLRYNSCQCFSFFWQRNKELVGMGSRAIDYHASSKAL